MMPELGAYATEVLSAYAVTLVLLAVLVGASLRRGAKVKALLKAAEARRGRDV
jgi:heme exporter protein D